MLLPPPQNKLNNSSAAAGDGGGGGGSAADEAAAYEAAGEMAVLSFALFTTHEKLKDYGGAWRHVSMGNALEKARRPQHDPRHELANVGNLMQVFTPGFWPAGVGSRDATPIFVVGMMRSGSSLVEQILSAHPAVYVPKASNLPQRHTPSLAASWFALHCHRTMLAEFMISRTPALASRSCQ